MHWKPITDLPDDWTSLVSIEVESLAKAWEQNYQDMKDTPMLETFNERLRREWSIETGIIERLYTIDRGTTQLLIEQGIDSAFIPSGATDRPVGDVIHIIQDQREALDSLFAYVKQEKPLTLHYIRTLHQLLLRHQEYTQAVDQFGNLADVRLDKGSWKRLPNNPQRDDGSKHEYCPPEHTQSEMDRLVAWHNQHLQQNISPQIEAAWLHHRFTQIHPFQDGNGRVARCLATLVLIRAGRFPLVIHRDHRKDYLEALEQADRGNLAPLVHLFDRIQKQSYKKALQLSEDIMQTPPVIDTLIGSIAEKYHKRQQVRDDLVFELAQELHRNASDIMQDFASRMEQEFQQHNLPIRVRRDVSNGQTMHWYRGQIVSTARKLGYFANLSRPRFWVRLKINDVSDTSPASGEIVVSLHYFGKENRGVMIATAFLHIPHASHKSDAAEDDSFVDEQIFHETHALVDEGFTFTHVDSSQSQQQQKEFCIWLKNAVMVGLAEWRKQI